MMNLHGNHRRSKHLLAGLLALTALAVTGSRAFAELKYELPDFEVEIAMQGAVFYPEQADSPRKPALLIEASRFGDRGTDPALAGSGARFQ